MIDNESCEDSIRRQWGDEAVELIKTILNPKPIKKHPWNK